MSLTDSEWCSAVRRMTEADWSFTARRGGREFHPYPARFIPDIPRQVLALTAASGVVVDPFCGSGTTLFEARRAGLDGVGSDINPVACLISRVRSADLSSTQDEEIIKHAHGLVESARSTAVVESRFAHIPRLDHWFTNDAQRAMSGAVSYLASLEDADPIVHDVLSVAVSAATVKISRQDSDTRYAAIDREITQATASEYMRRSIERTREWLLHENNVLRPDTRVSVVRADAQDLSHIGDESATIAIFSPPYPNAYEYWLYHKYRMYWLGFDAVEVRGLEIGARPHYSRPNGLTERDFLRQMTTVYAELERVLKPGAPIVAVIGDSVIGGRTIDNGELLAAAAEAHPTIRVDAIVDRQVSVARSSFNRAHSRGRKSEHLVLARKQL